MKRYKMGFILEAVAKVGGDKIKVSGTRSCNADDEEKAYSVVEQGLRVQYEALGFRIVETNIGLTGIE